MSKIKRGLFLGLVFVLLFSMVFVGCNNNNSNDNDQNNSQSKNNDNNDNNQEKDNTSNKSTNDEKDVKEENDEDEIEEVTLKYVFYGDLLPDSERVWKQFNEMLADRLENTQVEFMPIDGASYNQKTQLMVASGEDFDTMWAAVWKGDAPNKLAGGAFLPIEDLINEYAPRLYETIPDVNWAVGEYAGIKYGVPKYEPVLGVKSIGIIDEYYQKYAKYLDEDKMKQMAYDFDVSLYDILKELEPALEVAIEDDLGEYALMGRTFEGFLHSYDWVSNVGQVPIIGFKKGADKMVAENIIESKEFKDVIMLYANWGEKGYFPSDVASFLKLPNNKIGSVFGIGNGAIYANEEAKAEGEKTGIAFHGEIIDEILVSPPYQSASSTTEGVFINRNSKHPERAIQFLDVLTCKENADLFNLYAYGIKDEHYSLDENNMFTKIDGNEKYRIREWLVGNTTYSAGWQSELRQEIAAFNTDLLSKSPVAAVTGFKFNMEPVKNEMASVTNVVSEYKDGFMFGMYGDDTEEKYNELLEMLDTAGINKIVAEVQKQMDELAAIKGN